jgi:hypothetical protein
MLGRTSGPKREEIRGQRNLRNEKFHNLYSPPNTYFFFSVPVCAITNRGCLMAPWFLCIVLVPCADDQSSDRGGLSTKYSGNKTRNEETGGICIRILQMRMHICIHSSSQKPDRKRPTGRP